MIVFREPTWLPQMFSFSPPNGRKTRLELPLTEATVLLNAISIHKRQKKKRKKTYQLLKFIGDESCCRLPAIIFQKKKKSPHGHSPFFYIKQHEGFLKRDAPLVVSLSHG